MAALRIVSGRASGAELEVEDALLIGRGAGDDGALGDDPEISRDHARITRAGSGDLVIQDLGSTNGTFVNGRRITAPEPLRPGDQIKVGTSTIEVLNGDGAEPAQATQAAVKTVPQPVQPTTVGATRLVAPADGGNGPATPTAPVAPPATPAGAPPAGIGTPGAPQARRGRPKGRIVLLVIALLAAGAIAAIVLSGGGTSTTTHDFTALAYGVSTAERQPNGEDMLILDLGFVEGPFGVREVHVEKLIDVRSPPPFRVHDGTYTITDANGDELVLDAEGEATAAPEPPDNFFGRSDETWTVRSGTGRYEGASGEGRVLSAVVLQALRGPADNAVVKHFSGEIELEE